jgi:large subunit ribosomal protein L28
VSHANNKTRRRWNANLQAVRAKVSGANKRITVCTSCIKTGKVVKG